MKDWLEYFEHNRDCRVAISWDKGLKVEPRLREHLIRSLQKFQLGESGEGRHLRRQAIGTNDADYVKCIDLFIKEEQEHARLMAEILKRLETPLLRHHWSDGCFKLLRRMFGLKHELMVLLIPEMMAKRFFRALHDGTQDVALRAVFAQICHDEEGHLGFHIDYLRKTLARLPLLSRISHRVMWRVAFRASCVAMLADHRRVLRECGVSAATFWWDCGLIFDEVAAGIFSCAPGPGMAGRQLMNLQTDKVAKPA